MPRSSLRSPGTAAPLRWVRQEDSHGCGVAVLAMLLGRTYADVRAEIDSGNWHGHKGDWSASGVTYISLDRMLTDAGYFLRRRYESWGDPWPPEPFAPVHLAQVKQPSGNSHFVVMDAEGRVLDPFREGVYRLTDWPGVNNVVGLVRPADSMVGHDACPG